MKDVTNHERCEPRSYRIDEVRTVLGMIYELLSRDVLVTRSLMCYGSVQDYFQYCTVHLATRARGDSHQRRRAYRIDSPKGDQKIEKNDHEVHQQNLQLQQLVSCFIVVFLGTATLTSCNAYRYLDLVIKCVTCISANRKCPPVLPLV